MRFVGFEPCFDANGKILILGSFPSIKSRENLFYYGNPNNRFWSVLSEAYDATIPITVEEKRAFVLERGISLWDIVTECEIEGSLDANIRNYKVADLSVILNKCNVEKIILNGKKAASIFKKNYPHLISKAVFLPSTSPANTKFDKKVWLSAFK